MFRVFYCAKLTVAQVLGYEMMDDNMIGIEGIGRFRDLEMEGLLIWLILGFWDFGIGEWGFGGLGYLGIRGLDD